VRIPFLRPNPARLSKLLPGLEAIEASGTFTNYGPVNSRFEAEATAKFFGGRGGCLTVNNATIGLMLALREAAGEAPRGATRYALMPSFTFAATAHAAIWAGLTPLLCDIDPDRWTPCARSEDALLERYAGQVAVVMPYATFGNGLDLDRYAELARRHGMGIVVDAAASLGSIDDGEQGFGTGFPHAIVYSMHATKTFATAEGGLIYCDDTERLARLRTMGNFGFGEPRTATMPGLNSKLSEAGALLALAKLEGFEQIVAHRAALADAYRHGLPGCGFQQVVGRQIAYQFMPVSMPADHPGPRAALLASLAAAGVAAGHYFSPHLAEQPYFQRVSEIAELPVTERVASRILSLPLADSMTVAEVEMVCAAVRAA